MHADAAAAAAVLAHGSLAAHSRNTVWSVSTNTSVPSVPGGVHVRLMVASAAAMASLASAAVTPSPRCAASWNSRISRSGKLRRARLGCTNWLPRSGASTNCTKLLSPSAGVSEPVSFGMRRIRPDGDPSASQIRQTVCLVPAARRLSDRPSRGMHAPARSARGEGGHFQRTTPTTRESSLKSIASRISRGQGYLPARGRRAPLTGPPRGARTPCRMLGCTRGHGIHGSAYIRPAHGGQRGKGGKKRVNICQKRMQVRTTYRAAPTRRVSELTASELLHARQQSSDARGAV